MALHTEPRAEASDPLSKTLLDRQHQVHGPWRESPKPSRERKRATHLARPFWTGNTRFMASEQSESSVDVINLVFLARWRRWELVARFRSRLGM